MKKICRTLLLAALALGSSATPYLGLGNAEAAPPKGHCITCALYMNGLCWIVIAEGDC